MGGEASELEVQLSPVDLHFGLPDKTQIHTTDTTHQNQTYIKESLSAQNVEYSGSKILDEVQLEPESSQSLSKLGMSESTVVYIETGIHVLEDELSGVEFASTPIRFQIKINPAGFVDEWEIIDQLPEPFIEHPEYLNTLIRSMTFERKGESYTVEWLGFMGKKDDRRLAKLELSLGVNNNHK